MKSLQRFFSKKIKSFAKRIKCFLFKKISNSHLDKPFHVSKSSLDVLYGIFKKHERNKVRVFMLGYVFEIQWLYERFLLVKYLRHVPNNFQLDKWLPETNDK